MYTFFQVCDLASEQIIANFSSSSNEVTVPQIEQAGNETPPGTTTPVAGLSEPQFRRHTTQDEEHRRSSGPTDISLSSMDPSSQTKLVQYPVQVTANGKLKAVIQCFILWKAPVAGVLRPGWLCLLLLLQTLWWHTYSSRAEVRV